VNSLTRSWPVFLLLALLVLPTAAPAHFLLNLNVRIFHVDHVDGGLVVYVRMPLPYVLAGKTGLPQADGLPEPAPYTFNRYENDVPMHYVDFRQWGGNPLGLASLLGDGLTLSVTGRRIDAEPRDVRLYRLGSEPPFATLDEAIAGFSAAPLSPSADERMYVGDAVIDAVFYYPVDGGVNEYRLSSELNPQLEGQDDTANLILDYAPGGVEVFRVQGLMAEPVVISRSPVAAVATFFSEGVIHILKGLDHVFFVLCLIAGVFHVRDLLLRVTGFTVGHSITLAIGFFGYVPNVGWFIPAIELLIALSIIVAAIPVLINRGVPAPESKAGAGNAFLMTAGIGLVHGLGFSFVLHEILRVTSPDIWQSLLAFNLGIEAGQLLIVAAAATVFAIAGVISLRCEAYTRLLVVAVATVFASVWGVQRFILLLSQV